MKKVYLLDKHQMFTQCLSLALENNKEYKVIGSSSNKSSFFDSLNDRAQRPDVLVVDFNKYDEEIDISLIEELHKRRFKIKILALCSDMDLYLFSELIKNNIDGLLLKSCDISNFFEALDSLCDDRKYIYSPLIPIVNSYMVADSFEEKKIDDLTNREKEILKYLARGFTNKEIAYDLCISERTVKNHIFNIFKKIDCTDRTQATLFVIRNHIFHN